MAFAAMRPGGNSFVRLESSMRTDPGYGGLPASSTHSTNDDFVGLLPVEIKTHDGVA